MPRDFLAYLLHICICTSLIVPLIAHKPVTLNREPGFEALLSRDRITGSCDISYAIASSFHKALRHASVHVETRPAQCAARPSCAVDQILILAQTETLLLREVERHCKDIFGELGLLESSLRQESSELVLSQSGPLAPALEIHALPGLVTGPSTNRVDIVFFSDGYTALEKSKFLDDATRLGHAITINQTYAPVAPVLNFWGAFTPSEESGIGVGGEPKKTVYGLYRDGTELRGVYTSKPRIAHAACKSMGRRCNYPLLLGNDPLYGGLGGEFTISTASMLNGPLVLRHELGHSIIWVGDEYDGSTYFGVNAAPASLSHNISWAHWLTNPSSTDTPPVVQRNALPLLVYPWTMLNKTTPWSTKFPSGGTFHSSLLRFSLSGVPETKHLEIYLDGETVEWEANEEVGFDRWFYDVKLPRLEHGFHELVFALKPQGKEGVAQLCSVEMIEYGTPDDFNMAPGFVGAFPTYSPEVNEDPGPDPDRFANHHPIDALAKDWKTVSYRPTNEGCLMRQVAMPDFCVVCTEGLWLRLLARVSLIDRVDIKANPDGWVAQLSLLSLAHLRSAAGAEYLANKGVTESYLVRWFENGKEEKEWKNKTELQLGRECGRTIGVEVTFASTEIRKDERGYTTDRREVVIDCI